MSVDFRHVTFTVSLPTVAVWLFWHKTTWPTMGHRLRSPGSRSPGLLDPPTTHHLLLVQTFFLYVTWHFCFLWHSHLTWHEKRFMCTCKTLACYAIWWDQAGASCATCCVSCFRWRSPGRLRHQGRKRSTPRGIITGHTWSIYIPSRSMFIWKKSC